MNIGFLGLGKLGLPVALAIESKGHKVAGNDISQNVENIVRARNLPYMENGAQELLEKTNLELMDLQRLVDFADIIFVPIQTPHEPRYEGITPLPDERKGFDYSWLKNGMKDLSDEIKRQGKDKIVVIISTLLPGTIRKEIKPLLCTHVKLCYNPFFIAMGTTIENFLHPEFVLLGRDDLEAAEIVKTFYRTIHNAQVQEMSIENAELTKVAYNTFISTKIAFVNTIMELCEKTGCNIDVVMTALGKATDRLISTKYMAGGMGDGGSCHPRDNIALSCLAREVNLSYDFFESIMVSREHQARWLASLMHEHGKELPKVILGTSYKPETNLQAGSHALLVKNIIESAGEPVIAFDPYIHKDKGNLPEGPAIYLIGTKHPEFTNWNFPKGSIVIDPWGHVQNHREDVKIIHIGRAPA